MTDVYSLPPDLPVPEDDGGADHLAGLELPDLELESSQGTVNVRDFGAKGNGTNFDTAAIYFARYGSNPMPSAAVYCKTFSCVTSTSGVWRI